MTNQAANPIAIIGLGLRLPGAERLDDFWKHLAAARSLIGEVPSQRWSPGEWQGNPARENKTNSVWGGFVADADCFDADFFNISPREAAWMDPQQRFALEMAWHAIEDAGYSARALAGSRTGVFMGVCHWDYAELLEKHLAHVDAYTPTGIAFSIIANRISHFFDFHGPSVVNDTACAASLTSVHDAVRALQAGECDLALAGGVNLIWSPNHFVAFSKAGMLSKDGRAKVFDDNADGYVRGEGGAILLLKPLARALADNDPIHGVIRGVGINHGGRTNSLTVTNPKAQAELIARVFREADISPDSVSYIEAHGTGTPLGDPIEIAGLKQAFAELANPSDPAPRPGSCGIGSVKTNIGHLEGAAGVAGMVKILAAFRHETLPANAGFERLNRLIDLSGTPFRIQAEATPWPSDAARPRRAAVSSFGFGGSNAHLVLEEAPARRGAASAPTPVIIALSAKNDNRLAALVASLQDFIENRPPAASLTDLAFTLQTGREAMESRLAVVAEDWDELAAALRQPEQNAHRHDALHALAADWMAGKDVDWLAHWQMDRLARRIHAPLYPFARQRHWMDESLGAKDEQAVPHPLLHRNLSNLSTVRYRTRLKGAEYFWADHHVGGIQILPGVALLEMVRAAAGLARDKSTAGIGIENVVWLRPVQAGPEPTAIDINLEAKSDDTLSFTVHRTQDDAHIHCQGTVRLNNQPPPAPVALDDLLRETPNEIAVDDCYARLAASGVVHGPAFKALTQVRTGTGLVVAQLKLGRRLHPTLTAMPLHPVLLDAAIQAWIGLDSEGLPGAAVPFACHRIDIFGPCEPVMWACVRYAAPPTSSTLRRLDIELLAKDGSVRVVLRDLSLRIMASAEDTASETNAAATSPAFLAKGQWQPMPVSPNRESPMTGPVVLAGLPASVAASSVELPPIDLENIPAVAKAWFSALHREIAQSMREKSRHRRQILVFAHDDLPACVTAPLAALLRTAAIEQPKLEGAVIRLGGPVTTERLEKIIAAERRRADTYSELHYDAQDRRSAWTMSAIDLPQAMPVLDPDGVYWITGGRGGLGQLFAGWLAARGAKHIVLSGRNVTAEGDFLQMPCDVTDRTAVEKTVARINSEVGPLKGVIHAAGLLSDGFILTRDPASEMDVLAPKVTGTLNLDWATKGQPLDFMLLCSSVAGVFGNAGQGGYGAANAFMDAFAEQRNAQAAKSERQGRTIAVAWPLWAEGGMRVDSASLEGLHRRFGTVPMPTPSGLDALDRILSANAPARVTVMYGEKKRLIQTLNDLGAPADEGIDEQVSASSDGLAVRTQDFVRDILADVLQIEPKEIRVNRKLEEYGLDSIAIVEATNRLEEKLGPLSKTLFFEYVDLAGIAAHLAEEHGAALSKALAMDNAQALPARAAPQNATKQVAQSDGQKRHDIAIVGLSLRVAKASDQDAFWDMLAQGIDGFEPYPQDRWNHDALLHPERDVLGKTVVRTGAFLDRIDAFDPRYFRISQYEAELMSPEVRLFLEASVEAFEDAGYSRETMHRRFGGDVAVIVGTMTNEYDLYGFQNMLMRGALASGSYTGTIPNMVSYYYGFTGPSYFLDTMCSASSTCVHEAVHMLRAGRCKMALAGGVSLLLHPQKLIATSQEHFTSKTAEVIRGYGLGADGTILGEGVGALVLKTLEDAERDGDHIYGVIRGTAISNAGVRNGFTVPNPRQQAVAIEQALDDAGIDAKTIGYIEGHGSGTSLGDPIEIKALTQIFAQQGVAPQTCPIGTVKSNVAHLLAASGLAGIAKVLMQMAHGQLAPSLHAETLNPNIPFSSSPFYVQRTLAPWTRKRDSDGQEIPRRAGVTSIGAGGMNSHIVIEEYAPPMSTPVVDEPQLLVFSAMSEARLVLVAERFLKHLERHPDHPLGDLAFTLQVGKNELSCRLAIVVDSRVEAVRMLQDFVTTPGTGPNRHYVRTILDHDPKTDGLDEALEQRDLNGVARAWITGATVDWERLHTHARVRRLSLPAYPFEQVRCWYPEFSDAPSVTQPLGSKLKLHPLIGVNRSNLDGLRYTTAIHLDELLDYRFKLNGTTALLPSAAIEAVTALARIAGLEGPLAVNHLRVVGDIDWTTSRDIEARVTPDGADLRIQLSAIGIDKAATIWAEAFVASDLISLGQPAIARNGSVLTRAEIYSSLSQRGFDFTPYLEVIEQAQRLDDGAILCRLTANPRQQDHAKSHVQFPAPVLGAAYQALLLIAPDETLGGLSGVEKIVLGEPASAIAQILARPGRLGFDLWFLDATDGVVACLEGWQTGSAETVRPEAVPAFAAPDRQMPLALELRDIAANLLKFPPDQIGLNDPFHDLGFDSISLTRLAEAISTAYGITLSPAIFFECESLSALGAHLRDRKQVRPQQTAKAQPAKAATAPLPVQRQQPKPPKSNAIAVIGMAGRFPGSANIETFFDHLQAGHDLIGDLPLNRYGQAYAGRMAKASFAKRGGFLDDIDRFDAAFFRISPAEAERMDPQQRLMLTIAWRTFEDAGYKPEELPADTAVLIGASNLDYAELLRAHCVACDGYVATGNSLAMIANRISHVFNLHGPSQTVDTACSSSLIALLRAADALRAGRCSAALVGGVNLALSAEGFEGPHQAGMLSPEGRCKTFGAGADGYVRGEGVAALLLKRQDDAERDGDRILGLLIGGAENHGGHAGSLTAPSVNAQAQLVQKAMGGIDPLSISYIEAHGTGTALGDPVEVNGLRRAYDDLMGGQTVPAPFIGLGSVKSNIGHLEAAAGLAGVVKVLMAMRNGVLPASLHCATANPHMELAGSPFYLLSENQPWPASKQPRRAAVSSFGFGGANAHVVLEEYASPNAPRRHPLPPRQLAESRYWLPINRKQALVLTPSWQDSPLIRGPVRTKKRLVVPCAIKPAQGLGAEILNAADDGYEAMARLLLTTLQNIAKGKHGDDVLLQLAVPLGDDRQLMAGLGGMLDTAVLESSRLSAQVIEVEADIPPDSLARLLADEAQGQGDSRVRHIGGHRKIRVWNDLPENRDGSPVWTLNGVFLITGGMGALGRLIARHIASSAKNAVLVLAGSSPETAERASFLAELRAMGAAAVYRQVNVSDPKAVADLVAGIVEVHGAIDTVIHCAGILKDGYIARKSEDDLLAVLSPKVGGAKALFQACEGLKLRRMILFSSLSGVAGNAGQADYAAANGYLDALAELHGLPLVSIDWPLWQDGGMHIDGATADALFNRMGQRPMDSAQGLAALDAILAAGVARAAVMAGDESRIRAFFAAVHAPHRAASPSSMDKDDRLGKLVAAELNRLFVKLGGFAEGAIRSDAPLEDYGIDSLMISRLNATLSDAFGRLPMTLFFEFRTIDQVADHLASSQPDACRRWVKAPAASPSIPDPHSPTIVKKAASSSSDPIAIIGMSGRYPGAETLDEFWNNLLAGRDCVTEIPPERWDLDGFYHPDSDEAVEKGLSYAKWGGFLEGFADFDPLFFKIAPRDAAGMDPQERLFLMAAWQACEDGGYSPSRLAANGGKVGVFVGATKTGFALHGPFQTEDGAKIRPSTSFASIASRVSFALNLSGPSLPIDTMCSSSLVALHEACEHLKASGIGMALVGGVNLYLHPSNFIELCAARMLSPDGRCRSFGAGANGFVPGEGVGCLLLKPLSLALADNDRIHAVIRATAVNHGGHANGYTVPNPAAQRDLIREALAKAGLSARAITCIEAHGTGTDLGDPIEATALAQAFAADTQDTSFCALGSVKSNIGHLEAAAGIAGISKVVLQMKHGMLAPTLHADTINPKLHLDASPFVLSRQAAAWTATGPRIAGVSSFGASGVNAHAIIEEWPGDVLAETSDHGPQTILLSARTPERLQEYAKRLLAFVEDGDQPPDRDLKTALRAKLGDLLGVAEDEVNDSEPFDSIGLETNQRLALWRWLEDRLSRTLDYTDVAQLDTLDKLAAHFQTSSKTRRQINLADLAYTLQVGREAMDCRLGFEADTLERLASSLRAWLDGQDKHPGLYSGQMGDLGEILDLLGSEAELQSMVERWWSQGRTDKILPLWVKGLKIDWQSLPRTLRPSIVSLPTYPFERRRFWLPDNLSAAILRPCGDALLSEQALKLDDAIAIVLNATLNSIPASSIRPDFSRWLEAAKRLLAGHDRASSLADAWRNWQASQTDGGTPSQIKLAETALRGLPDILTGRQPATSVLFPEGSMALVEAVYKDNRIANRFNRALAHAALSFVRQAPNRQLRILEIGAGTGGTSEAMFEALKPVLDRIEEYCYTDVSQAFLIHAERAYRPRLAQLTTALLDIEKPPGEQGLALGAYDLIVAANVLHATADMKRTLAHVQDLLAPGGLLLLNETSQASLFTHVTFGLLEGWWRFTDPERRIPGTPSLSRESWKQLLTEAGLNWLAGSRPEECALGQQIVAARMPGDTKNAPVALPTAQRIERPSPAQATGNNLRETLLALLGETLNLPPASILLDRPFADYGLDSILGAELTHKIRRALKVEIEQRQLFDFATAAQLEAYLAGQCPKDKPAASAPAVISKREPIAIVGLSGRFADSPDVEALWSHLAAGDDLVGPTTRFDLTPFYRDAEPGSYGDRGSFIDGVWNFDPTFFGISGLEATYMDPQQRLFLEEAWKTLENAGHAGDDIVGRKVGVFVGASSGDYQELFKKQPPGQAFWGNTSSLIPARIAYFLDLKGPAVAIDTACSSSLVAVHMACQSLWSGESEMALAGGVFVQCSPRFFRYANQAKMLSPSGKCAPFGANADGIVPGEGVAAVLLRPLSDALRDGDTIHGVIIGSGTNQDGTTNGITAPSAVSQEKLIRQVLGDFAIDPASIGLLEAHGTGTVLGDPIEHAALAKAFGPGRPKSCALGSIKANIGHATTAAGIAGLVKALLCLRHGAIPPTLHFNGGNPAIRFEDGPFHVNTQLLAWPQAAGLPRRAAVSSFGFSGTNAHVVVEEAPRQPGLPSRAKDKLFVLSARNAEQLRQQAERLAQYLENDTSLTADDVAFTLLTGRRHLHHRLAVVAKDLPQLAAHLRAWLFGNEDSVVLGTLGDTFRSQDAAWAPPDTPLDQLARLYVGGARLDAASLFGEGRRRVPLPAYPFAALRHWVEEPAKTSPAAMPLKSGAAIRLADPAQLAVPYAANPAKPVTTLASLAVTSGPSPAVGRSDDNGVCLLTVTGAWGERAASELTRADADQAVRAIVITGLTSGTVLPPCTLPVVTTVDVRNNDFTARDDAAAMTMARRIAEAPRLALVELKKTMREPGRLPPRGDCELERLLAGVGTSPASSQADAGSRLPLATTCLELSLTSDGVALLCMTEHRFTDAFMDGILEAFAAIARLDRAKVVVLTGQGGTFASGGTQEGLNALQRGETRFTDRKIYSLPLDCPLPVIAAMQGHAIGAGWSLGMFCDAQLFAAEALYHSNYLRIGFTPGAGATLIFPHRLGDALGREVLFTAHEYRGKDLLAHKPDLHVLPAGQVLASALALAHGLAREPRDRLIALKAQARQPIAQRLQGVFAQELAMHEKTFIGSKIVQERLDKMFGQPSVTQAKAAVAGDEQIRDVVISSLAEDLMIAPADIRDGASFLELGLDSILAVTWIRRLNGLLGVELSATAVYAHPTVGALVAHLKASSLGMPIAQPSAPPVDADKGGLRQTVIASLAEDLMIAPADIRDGASFLELGLDSILAVTWIRRLNGLLGVDLPATAVYAHPTVGALVAHLGELKPLANQPPPVKMEITPSPAIALREAKPGAVAIIGASGRFPKAPDLDMFWDNIRQGRDCIEDVPPSRWDVERFYHPDPLHPGTSYCRKMGAIDDIDRFDAAFFNITPREAELMDPQQRLFLEHAWHAFEDAGLSPDALAGSRCGVFVGAGPSGYANLIDEHNSYSLLGCSGSILAARIAHLLDLRGPCISLDTACSSSLVAIAEACNSLLVGDSDLALAGGVCVMIGPAMFIDTSKVSMLSQDGHCYTFDQRANGFVPGEGAGVLLLKRLEDAERDGDPVHAVIRGWGLNQDGRTNGITAPNPQAQTRLIKGIYQRFGIAPASIGLIEAHGTGTPLGDPIEIEGLTDAFAGSNAPAESCALGSVKSNVGHLLAAAGVAGAIKAMQAVEKRQLPPTIQFENLNEHISLKGTPFAINTRLRDWPRNGSSPRRAGVSAFGFSGTNAHLVIEEHAQRQTTSEPGPWLFVLSARTPERLAEYAGILERFVSANPNVDLGNLTHTLQVGRKAHRCRLAMVVDGRDSLLRGLASVVAGRPMTGIHLSGGDTAAGASRLDNLARQWVKGEEIDWKTVSSGRRIHLPGYPFARDRHWVAQKPAETPIAAPAAKQTLLDTLSGPTRIPLLIRGNEPHLTSHTSGSERLLLGLFLLELTREALERAAGRPIHGLKHLLWGTPLRVNGKPRELSVVIDNDDLGLLYHVTVDGQEETPCHVGEAMTDAELLEMNSTDALPSLDGGDDVTAAYNRFAADLSVHSGPPAPEAARVLDVSRHGDTLSARLYRQDAGKGMAFDPLTLDTVWRLAAFHAQDGRKDACQLPFPQAMRTARAKENANNKLLVRIGRNANGLAIAVRDDVGAALMNMDGVQMVQASDLDEIRIEEESMA
jgi:acyl transferase domain-containing protein/acyl carrier protein/enoyl-CoA hydratase/carnithine racemase/NAD(P)-dependent dehydrogenase (short-subunit alcohol dehydrogenase family)